MMADRARTSGGWAAALLGLTIPVSIVADNVLLVVVVLAWIMAGDLRARIGEAIRNPLVVSGLVLFGLFVLGIFLYDGPASDAARAVGKYKELLLLVPLVCLLEGDVWRTRALQCFIFAMIVTLAGSFAIAAGLIPIDNPPNRYVGNPTVFKFHITHSFLMAIFAFVCISVARIEAGPSRRGIFAVLALLAAVNVLFMVKGRTGYVLLIALSVYAVIAWYRWKGAVIGLLALVAILGAGLSLSDTLRERTSLAVKEFREWVPGRDTETSIGLRLNFYQVTWDIIREHPLVGVGTGGFEKAYREKVAGTNIAPSSNPHNEYLMIGSQLGLVGVAAFVAMLVVMWRLSARLRTPFERDLARALVISYALGNLVNSLLLDHTEGLFFCWAGAALFAGMPRTGENRAA